MTNSIQTLEELLEFLLKSQNLEHSADNLNVLIDEAPDAVYIVIDSGEGTIASSTISPEMCSCIIVFDENEPSDASDFEMELTELVPALLNHYPETPCDEYIMLKAIGEWASFFCGVHGEDALLGCIKYADFGEVVLTNKGEDYRHVFMLPKDIFERIELALPEGCNFSEATIALEKVMRTHKIDALLQGEA